MPSLFISYRRGDSPDTVKLIHERLKKRLPRWDIFYDHESIPLGEQAAATRRCSVCSNVSTMTLPCVLRTRNCGQVICALPMNDTLRLA